MRGNIIIWLPNERVLMASDVVTPGWVPFKRLGVAEDIPAYLKAPDQLLSYPFLNYIGGHYTRVGTRQDVMTYKAFLKDLQLNAIKASEMVNYEDAIKTVDNPANLHLVSKAYMNAVIQACVQLTVPQWMGKLGGVDVFTEDACDVMILAQSLDFGNKLID